MERQTDRRGALESLVLLLKYVSQVTLKKHIINCITYFTNSYDRFPFFKSITYISISSYTPVYNMYT